MYANKAITNGANCIIIENKNFLYFRKINEHTTLIIITTGITKNINIHIIIIAVCKKFAAPLSVIIIVATPAIKLIAHAGKNNIIQITFKIIPIIFKTLSFIFYSTSNDILQMS